MSERQIPRNYKNLDSLNEVADYIFQYFQKFCPETRFQEYQVKDNTYKNVICFFKGKNTKRKVFGAHYDVADHQPGADDNASGVATLLELARLLSKKQEPLKNDIELVAYTLEEPPFFYGENMGSAIHAKSLKQSGIDLDYMVSIEMVGYYDKKPWSQFYPLPLFYLFFPHRGTFLTLIGGLKEYFQIRKLKSKMSSLKKPTLFSFNGPTVIQGLDYSDHSSYWKLGYNAYMVTDTSFFRNHNYHKTTDTIDTLNFDIMKDVTLSLYQLMR